MESEALQRCCNPGEVVGHRMEEQLLLSDPVTGRAILAGQAE